MDNFISFSDYVISTRSKSFYLLTLGDCIKCGLTIEEMLSNTYSEYLVLCDLNNDKTIWKPIDTAPKDGTRILIKTDDGTVYVCVWKTYEYYGKRYSNWVIPESEQDEQGGYFDMGGQITWRECPK